MTSRDQVDRKNARASGGDGTPRREAGVTRRRSPLLYAALAVAALTLAIGVWSLRPVKRATPIAGEVTAEPRSAVLPVAEGTAVRPRQGTQPPAPKRLDTDEAPQPTEDLGMWEGVHDQATVERKRLAELTTNARKSAGAELTPDEMTRVEEIHRRSDARWLQMEARAANAPAAAGPGGPLKELRAVAVDELDELTRLLGPARARALRLSEREYLRQLVQQEEARESLPTATRNAIRRRLIFLEWNPAKVPEDRPGPGKP